ncbi:MAG TPA: ATP-binding protein [Ohtaekwangia sp.]|nr:ATP-binding protein [Ohtaekwangia sp.]
MEKDLKVLVLEDLEDDMEMIHRVLTRAGLHVKTKRVDTREEFLLALDEFKADVILSDHALPQFNSVEALKLCRKEGLQIPFIVVTGAVSEEFAVNTLKQGADNYVLKSNLARLPSAINSALKHREDEVAKIRATEELVLQNEELTKINKELDSFVYSVSHNLKAPLSSVMGLLNLAKIEDAKQGNNFMQYFGMMERSIQKLDETLREIIDYSRNARKELAIEKIDFSKLVQDNLERMEYMPGADLIAKEISIDDDYPFYSDAYRLSVIFNNLISNAFKYADPFKSNPFLKIEITTTSTYADIRFEDNGIGIQEEYIQKVFDMFFRATMQKEGAGLGLYIVKEATDKLNGTIDVKSVVGEGTRFLIRVKNHLSGESL